MIGVLVSLSTKPVLTEKDGTYNLRRVKLGASCNIYLHLVYPPISTSKPFVTVFIQKIRRPGRQAPENTNNGAAHGLEQRETDRVPPATVL